MSESKLQREFQGRDLQRLRNIVSKDYNAKTGIQVGYRAVEVEHKEGDVWEEHGKKWTVKNGIKITATRLDSVKKALSMPLCCPKCNRPMTKGQIDKYMFTIHKTCFDCVIEYETELKRLGQFEEYQKNINRQSYKYHLQEMEDILRELSLTQSMESFVTEAGEVEKWQGQKVDNTELLEGIKDYIERIKASIQE